MDDDPNDKELVSEKNANEKLDEKMREEKVKKLIPKGEIALIHYNKRTTWK